MVYNVLRGSPHLVIIEGRRISDESIKARRIEINFSQDAVIDEKNF